MEFLVHMELTFPDDMTRERMSSLYRREALHARVLADAGVFVRCWRIPGRRAHYSLWEVPDATRLHELLESWPMFMYMNIQVIPLAVNHNDPGGVAEELPQVVFSYPVLRAMLDTHHAHGEAGSYDLGAGISIHDHPGTDRQLQVHVMCDGQKIAEIGPSSGSDPVESVVPGYIDFLAEWEGRPVRHERWIRRIQRDNDLLHSSYEEAVAASRFSRRLIAGQ